MNKKTLREKMLAQRLSLDGASVMQASKKITAVFLDKWGHYESFLLYSPIRNEIDTAYMASALWKAGKMVLYPRVEGDNLLLGECRGMDDLQAGCRGILEPCRTCDIRPIQVAVIPGVAFDVNKYRLGYGKGYYDRFLATAHIDVRVGVAYEWQMVESVFPCEHDQPVDIVVTG